MGKKFIKLPNGEKMYIDEKDVQDEDTTTPPNSNPDLGDDEEVKKTAKALGKALRDEMGIDQLRETVENVQKFVMQPENDKLKQILHGKDIKDKGQLTANEKIVGFFHGIVTQDRAVVKALSEGVDADGGYLFPNEFLAELIKPLPNVSSMRQLVTVVPMRRDALTVPSQGNRPKMYWTAENASKTTTTASFGTVTITAKKVAAILYASDELIEDSSDIDVVNHILTLFREALGEEEDRVILRGNGTTEPRGIETARAAGEIATTTWNGTTFDKAFALIYSLKAKYRAGASFLMHPNTVARFTGLKDSNGQYLWQPSVVAGQPDSIRGYPVYEFYDMPENTVYFGNWKQAYWLGDRKRLTVKISQDTETAFVHDQTAIRVVARFGGNVVLGEAAKAATGA